MPTSRVRPARRSRRRAAAPDRRVPGAGASRGRGPGRGAAPIREQPVRHREELRDHLFRHPELGQPEDRRDDRRPLLRGVGRRVRDRHALDGARGGRDDGLAAGQPERPGLHHDRRHGVQPRLDAPRPQHRQAGRARDRRPGDDALLVPARRRTDEDQARRGRRRRRDLPPAHRGRREGDHAAHRRPRVLGARRHRSARSTRSRPSPTSPGARASTSTSTARSAASSCRSCATSATRSRRSTCP